MSTERSEAAEVVRRTLIEMWPGLETADERAWELAIRRVNVITGNYIDPIKGAKDLVKKKECKKTPMSRILFFLVALIAVVFAVLVFAPGIIPVAAYKDRIEIAASNAVGREVTIGDNLSFRIVPHTAFHVENLEIANADGFDGAYLARVSEADIGVKLFSLLSGVVEVDWPFR